MSFFKGGNIIHNITIAKRHHYKEGHSTFIPFLPSSLFNKDYFLRISKDK